MTFWQRWDQFQHRGRDICLFAASFYLSCWCKWRVDGGKFHISLFNWFVTLILQRTACQQDFLFFSPSLLSICLSRMSRKISVECVMSCFIKSEGVHSFPPAAAARLQTRHNMIVVTFSSPVRHHKTEIINTQLKCRLQVIPPTVSPPQCQYFIFAIWQIY